MKKIISLLLALVCVFAFISCGEKDTALDKFIATVEGSSPTKIITQTSYSDSENTFSGWFETTIVGSDFEMTYEYYDYAIPSPDANPDESIAKHSGTVYYVDGLYSTDGENWSASTPSAGTLQVALNLTAENLGEYVISADGKTLTATLTAEEAEALLGISVSATDDGVSVTITNDGRYLRSISVVYATENATLVSLQTTYTYNAVSLSISTDDVEQTPAE